MSTTPQQYSTYPLVYRNLMAVGLLGSCYRTHDDADIVGAAVDLTLDNPAQFRIYRAVAQGIGGQAEAVRTTLAEQTEKENVDDATKVALAVSLMLAGDPGWKALIDNVMATSDDQSAREAASGVIAYLQSLTPA